MIYWAPFLHFYQPPTQFHAVLKKICNESYRPLVRLFQAHPAAKVTINICGVLTELLMDHGGADIVCGMKELAERGQLEFVGSSKYHAILPLIPEEEMKRQIELNNRTNSFFFGDVFNPKGFFPPEMCYSSRIVSPLEEKDFKWILLGGIACNKSWPMDKIYRLRTDEGDTNMAVFFRDDILSNKISFHGIDSQGFIKHLNEFARNHNVANNLTEENSNDIYVVTAMDAETFGHHIRHWEKLFLEEVYEAVAVTDKTYEKIKQRKNLAKEHKEILDSAETEEIKVVTLSELVNLFPKPEYIEPTPSSWSTSADEIKQKNYYPLWNSPDNLIHKYQWEHIHICMDLVKKAKAVSHVTAQSKPYADLARGLLDRALYSCQWWWASRRPMWDINLINKGLAEQEQVIFNAYKAIELSLMDTAEKKGCYYKVIAARDIADKIRDILFTT
jgi:alpha-amylase/alpha-mannosidase (GH57 family)